MYRIKLYDGPDDSNGTVIHSPYANGTKVKFDMDLVMEGISSMEFTINPKSKKWGNIENLDTLIRVHNIKTGKLIFDGRVLMPTQQMSSNGMFTIKYVCESKKAYLHDSRPRYAKLQDISISDTFAWFINRHNSLMPPHKRFKVGICTVTSNTDNVYKFVGYGTTYEEIQENLIDKYGGYLVMREESDGTYLDYLAEVGEVKNAPIKLRKNLQDMRRDIDPTNVITRIVPLGARLEAAEGQTADASMPRLDIKSVNNGLDYIEDAALIDEFGVIEGVLELDNVNTPSTLKLRGQQFFEQQRAARVSYDVSALNMNLLDSTLDEYEVGNWYPIDNPGFAINENLQVIGLKINGDTPQKNTLVIGEKHVALTDYQIIANKAAKRSLKIQETVDRQSALITSLNSQVNNVNNVVDVINVQIGEADLPGLKQSVNDLNANVDTLNQSIGDIPVYGPVTATESGLMIPEDKIKLDELENYTEATQTKSGLFSMSDKSKLDLISVETPIDLNDLLTRIEALETPTEI